MKHAFDRNRKTSRYQAKERLRPSSWTDKRSCIATTINEAMFVLQSIASDERLLDTVNEIAREVVTAYEKGNKVLLCGNGGSAADAQHIATELSGRFFFDRPPLSVEALHTNSSYITAVANDYSFDDIFSRLIRAQGNPGDILIALSTSGSSQNIINAVVEANRKDMVTVGFTGHTPNPMEEHCDYLFSVPDMVTPRIQECHILVSHIVCEIVENTLFSKQRPAVFLDRDGVISKKVSECNRAKKWSRFSLLPGACEAIRLLNDNNYLVVVVTTQQCTGMEITAAEYLQSVHSDMKRDLEILDAHIDAIYACSHTPQDRCSCRRPESGLLKRAFMDLRRQGISIDLDKSYLITDSASDLLTSKPAGLKALCLGESDYAKGRISFLDAVQSIVGQRG
jgi:D-sedoheptulose 7-phosphate isomerase